MNERTFGPAVLKLGGASALAAASDVAAFAAVQPRVCVVHGGGPQITALMRLHGVEARFSGGRRLTDLATLACVVQGLRAVSRELCEGLAAAGLRPVPVLSGVLLARRVPELGLVGRPVAALSERIEQAWAEGAIPVVAPLAAADIGLEPILNVNADDAAACTAAALGAAELIFVSDVPGVLDEDGELVPEIAASSPPPYARDGMLPKLEACAAAVKGGVRRVQIGLGGTVVTA
jgi:acetylglutamate kinase